MTACAYEQHVHAQVHRFQQLGAERHGCEFAQFFACERGACPQELLQRGIFAQIATALKGGPWREPSMVTRRASHATLSAPSVCVQRAVLRSRGCVVCAMSRLHLDCISAASRLNLGGISAASRVCDR